MTSKFSKYLVVATYIVLTCTSCSIFRATGQTVEAVGEGAGTAVQGVGEGTEEVLRGTGRAVSGAASGVSRELR